MAPFSGQTQGGSAPDEPQRRIPELEEALRRAEDSSRNKSAFIANLSHEIRTPLNSIIGVANLFQGTRLDLEQKKFVEMLSTSARDLHRLVKSSWNLSLIETGRLTLQSEPFPVRSNCSRTIRPLAVSIQERRLSLELQGTPPSRSTSGGQRTDEPDLRNMVTNAIAFTPKGTIRVRVFLEEETESSANLHVTAGHPDGGTGAEKRRDTDYSNMERKDFSASFQGAGMGLLSPGDRGSHGRETLDRVFGFRRQDHSFPGLPGKDTLRRGPSGEGREIRQGNSRGGGPSPCGDFHTCGG